MSNVFAAGQDLVARDLTALGARGLYRLTMRPPAGTIVEYCARSTMALNRPRELELLLVAARGGDGRSRRPA